MSRIIKAYACYNKDEKIRLMSSSGGFFSILAEYWLDIKIDLGNIKTNQRLESKLRDDDETSVVYGVAMTKDCYGAEYIRVSDEKGLDKLRGSKYLQATMGSAFIDVKKDLEDGRKVLFSGTGCVINGLKNFLQKEYENLFCVDVICHGVPPPALWEKYVKFQEMKYGKINDVNFRCKDNSWNDFGMKENQIYISKDQDSFMQMFLRDYCLRPSCYECNAKKVKKADLTIADFWGIENIVPNMNDGKGVSLVLVRTLKGNSIFEELKRYLEVKEVSYSDGVKYNPAEYKSVTRPTQRDYFFGDMQRMTFEELEKKYASPLPLSFKTIVKKKVKKILNYVKNFSGGGINQRSNEDYGLLFTFDEQNKMC